MLSIRSEISRQFIIFKEKQVMYLICAFYSLVQAKRFHLPKFFIRLFFTEHLWVTASILDTFKCGLKQYYKCKHIWTFTFYATSMFLAIISKFSF